MTRIKIEYENDFTKHKTVVEQTYEDNWAGSQFDTLLTEIAMCLMAIGYSEELVREGINYPQ
jgi:hypothetical protein